jgi:hypothetical protein
MPLTINKGEFWNLAQIQEIGRNGFIFNKEYQRGSVWKPKRQQRLIESIIKELSIGMFIVKKNGEKWEVLDGQQRLEAIFSFIEGEVRTPDNFEDFPEKKYDDLMQSSIYRPIFEGFEVYYEEVVDGRDAEMADIFLRLQEGVALNSAEKLNATIGKMRDFVYELSKHPFLKRGISTNEARFARRYLAAQMVLFELSSNFNHAPFPEFGNPRYGKLKEMYDTHKKSVPRWLRRQVSGVINSLHQTLGADAHVLCEGSDVPMVFLLASYLGKKYALQQAVLKEFIIDFFTRIAQVKLKEGRKPKGPYQEYYSLRAKGLTPDTINGRFRILVGLFLSRSAQILLKDPQRLFDVGQKFAIYYYKSRGKCQLATCRRKVDWDDASFHHVHFHSRGGPTTVDNGQLMHRACHVRLHANIGSDDDIV